MTKQASHAIAPLVWTVVLCLSGCGGDGASFLYPHGTVAAAQRQWLFEVTGLVMIVVLPVLVLVPLVAWRYRRGAAVPYRPDWAFSWPLEFAVWGIPVAIVAAISYIIIAGETGFDPYAGQSKKPPLVVQVVALDWKWLFIYPGQNIATIGTLALPQGQPVSFALTSDATMQSFLIPSLGSQIYAMAGMVTRLHLMADRPGTLLGENTLYNGVGYMNEKFRVLVMPPHDFASWTAKIHEQGRTLDEPAFRALSKVGTVQDTKKLFDVAPDATLSFASVKPNFFNAIVSKYHPMPVQASTLSEH